MSTDRFAEVNRARLYYEVVGQGKPVVLIHGFTLDQRMWDEQVAALAPHFQVIRYDLRGFGRSSLPSSVYSHVEDLKALLSHLGITHAAVLGLSMGGAVAVDFALAFPESTKVLLLADSTLRNFSWSKETDAQFDAVDAALQEGGVEAARERWLAHPFFAPALERPAVAHRLRAIVESYSGWHWTHADEQVVSSAAPQLESVCIPTLVIVGERDIADFRAISEQLVQRIPQARMIVLPGVGHMSNMESPDLFNRAVLRFLAENA